MTEGGVIMDFSEIINVLLTNVVRNKIEATITIAPDLKEITMRPWEPYRQVCPRATEEQDERSDN